MKLAKSLSTVLVALAAATLLVGCTSNSDGEGASTKEFCALAKGFSSIDTDDSAGAAKQYRKLAEAAPQDLKDDLTFLADTMDLSVEIEAEGDSPDPVKMAKLMENVQRLAEIMGSLPAQFETTCG